MMMKQFAVTVITNGVMSPVIQDSHLRSTRIWLIIHLIMFGCVLSVQNMFLKVPSHLNYTLIPNHYPVYV